MENSIAKGPISMNQTFHLKVVNVVKETADTTSIYFDIGGKEEVFRFTSGQYITVHFEIGGKKVSRAYSLFTAPFEKDFAITVKRVKGGLVSNYINDFIKIEDSIEVSLPRGNFSIREFHKNPKAYYFFGGGSGITPLLSLIKTLLKNEPLSQIYFLYGNRNKSSIIHQEVLNNLENVYDGRLHIEHELESEGGFFGKGLLSNLLQSKTGWIDKRRILYFLRDNLIDLLAEYFICGPSAMMNNVVDVLTEIAIDSKYIHLEHFGSEPEEVKNLNTSEVYIQKAVLTYTINGIMKQIPIKGNKTLFESLIQIGEDIPHSCLAGSCASCVCTIKKGAVKMKQSQGLNETQINNNFILSCQAIPQTKLIEIDFDAV